MTKAKLVTTSALTQVEPTLKDAIIKKVSSGVSLIQELRDLGKSYTDLLSPNTKNSKSTCTKEYFQSLKDTVVEKAKLIYGVYPKNGVSHVVTYKDKRAPAITT